MDDLGAMPGYRLAVRASYEARYRGWEAGEVARAARTPPRPIERILEAAELPAGGRLLDVGCGPGLLALAAALRRPALAVVGTDLSERALELGRCAARELGVSAAFLSADAESPPPGPFDRVTATSLLALLPDRAAALSAWRQALAPGGRIVIADGFAKGGSAGGPGPLPLGGLPALAAAAGLRVLRRTDLTAQVRQAHAEGTWWWGEYLAHRIRYAAAVLVDEG